MKGTNHLNIYKHVGVLKHISKKQEHRSVEWIHLAQDRNKWWSLANTL